MSEDEAKELIKGLYTYDDDAKIQEIYTKALNSANESSVIIPLNYRNEYVVYNNEKITSYTFSSIPNHVDVATVLLSPDAADLSDPLLFSAVSLSFVSTVKTKMSVYAHNFLRPASFRSLCLAWKD